MTNHCDDEHLLLRHGDVVREFANFAEIDRSRRFTRNWLKELEKNPQDRVAEALVWRMLSDGGCDPHIEVGIPGTDRAPDFKCTSSDGGPFYVEVASLRAEGMERRSGFDTSEVCAFSFDSRKMASITDQKNCQCRDADLPVVVAIVTFAEGSNILFGTVAAEELLWGGTGFSVPLDASDTGEPGPPEPKALIQVSAFLERAPGCATLKNEWVSSLLLLGVDDYAASVVALENPRPRHRLDDRVLRGIPILRLVRTGGGDAFRQMWSVDNPVPATWELP